MATGSRSIWCSLGVAGAIAGLALSQTPEPEGHVTSIFHDVEVVQPNAEARAAAINDTVHEGNALRTGSDSRSELTFADLTISRLGENTVFVVNRAGRSVRLDSGTILLYARKNSGGAQISSKVVSVGITGTTVIFESRPSNYDRLIVLEGTARFSLNNYPNQSTNVRAGQLLNVNAGARKLPKPGRVDLRRIVRTHPLIKNFPPLPSLDLIYAEMKSQDPNAPLPPPPTGVGPAPGGSTYPLNPAPITPVNPTPMRPTPMPTATVKPTRHPILRPTPTATIHRPGYPPRPTPRPTSTPKKRRPPPRRLPRASPTATVIIR